GPRCPYFGACGGCQLQHASYAHQLDLKRQVVDEAWARAGLRLPPDTPVLGMDDPWRYRIRGEFEAVSTPHGWRFGFHRMRSHSVLPVDSCVIHDARIENALPAFARAADELELKGLQNLQLTVEPTGPGLLWRLRFHGREPRWPREDFMARVARQLPDAVLLDDAVSIDFWDLTFRACSDTFVQTNYRQMQVLYRTALDMLEAKAGQRVLDLYAGIGTISVALAREGAHVTAVEENPHAIRLARLNARINSARVEQMPGKVEQVLRGVRLAAHDAAILDPPRAGCEPAALAELIRLGVPRLVYVSCEPSTHVRDIAGLVRGGYRVRRAVIVDMFPQTYHIESVALLERN
ncbi:MAG TPA: methyltransferase, partial [Candidatus Dormibacteraeota bacterium]|nr:methyltransferase [Candidatus Dormibacteraeota bacterium]